MAKKKAKEYGTDIELHEIEALARHLLPQIERYFASEEGQREFEVWRENSIRTVEPG